jgi:hypothetical protein
MEAGRLATEHVQKMAGHRFVGQVDAGRLSEAAAMPDLIRLATSANLALLYLAWLGYELRHGPSATFGRLAA